MSYEFSHFSADSGEAWKTIHGRLDATTSLKILSLMVRRAYSFAVCKVSWLFEF